MNKHAKMSTALSLWSLLAVAPLALADTQIRLLPSFADLWFRRAARGAVVRAPGLPLLGALRASLVAAGAWLLAAWTQRT
jgi:hypothetical protein